MSGILSFFRKKLNVWSATLSTSTACGFEYHDPLYFSKSIGEHESREQGDEVFRRARRPLSLQAQWLGRGLRREKTRQSGRGLGGAKTRRGGD